MVSPLKKRKLARVKKQSVKENINSKVSYKPLSHKKYYLDLNNYSRTGSLKQEIVHLGGAIEDFLSKEVNCVITNRPSYTISKGSSSDTSLQKSPGTWLTNSPTLNSCDSPNTFDSSKEDRRRGYSRSELLLERACLKRRGTSDVLENARLFDIPIWPLSKLLNFVDNLKESPLYHPLRSSLSQSKKGTESKQFVGLVKRHSDSRSSQPHRLHNSFAKVEAFNKQYRPHYKELPSWPKLYLSAKGGSSPFAEPKPPKQHKPTVHKDHTEKKPKTENPANKQKSGYCEICSSNFADLKLHLATEAHLAFVRDPKNYRDVDSLLQEYDFTTLIG